MEKVYKTCRLLFQNKMNLRYCASGWFYYRKKNWNNIMHLDSGHWNQGVQFWSPDSSY